MKERRTKGTASSARAFGQGSQFTGFGSSSSSISYLAEPPDLSLISDPSVAVHFKNLSKKDSTTKSKALEDLLIFVTRANDDKYNIEEGFIEAWVKVFPRLSSDVSRRVRQSVFVLQKQISKTMGKRIARHLTFIAPPWLAGSHDSDRAAARAAQEGLQSVFSTSEKQMNLRKAYQAQIIEFSENIINNETRESLNDPKTTSQEDAESVYNRSVSGSLDSVSETINMLALSDLNHDNNQLSMLVTSDKLWDLLSKGDTSTRRSIILFVKACFGKLRALVDENVDTIANAVMAKRTMRHQSGSSREFSELLTLLTNNYPGVWKGKSPSEVIKSLVKNGSQGGTAQFWFNVSQFISTLPEDVLPATLEEATEILETIRGGITCKDEPRTKYQAAFRCYTQSFEKLSENLPPDAQDSLADSMGFDLVRQYVRPSPELSRWTLPDSQSLGIVSELMGARPLQSAAEGRWDTLALAIVNDLRTSLPAQSKDFEESQLKVENEASRLFSLQGNLHSTEISTSLAAAFSRAHFNVQKESTSLLRARDGKPFGAAGCIIASLKNGGYSDEIENANSDEALDNFVAEKLPSFMFTPSRSRLITILCLFSRTETFEKAWPTCIEKILHHEDKAEKQDALKELLDGSEFVKDTSIVSQNELLQQYFSEIIPLLLASNSNDNFLDHILTRSSQILSRQTINEITLRLSQGISMQSEYPSHAFEALKRIAKLNPKLIKKFISSEAGAVLVENLLKLQEYQDENDAIAVTELLSIAEREPLSKSSGMTPPQVVKILQKSLYDASSETLPVSALTGLAIRQYQTAEGVEGIKELLPNMARWSKALEPYSTYSPPSSFAVTDVLGGFVSVNNPYRSNNTNLTAQSYDSEGFSPLFRISLYTVQLLSRAELHDLNSFDYQTGSELLRLLLLTCQIANDKLSHSGASALWTGTTGESEALAFVSELDCLTRPLVSPNPTLITEGALETNPISIDLMFNLAKDSESFALHYARIWATLKSEAIDRLGWRSSNTEAVEKEFLGLKKDENGSVRLAAFLHAFQSPLSQSSALLRYLNEAIADVTGLDSNTSVDLYEKVSILALILQQNPSLLDSVAKQRLVFLVKHTVPWLSQSHSTELESELCRMLLHVLPHMADVYGEDWERVVDYLAMTWINAPPLTDDTATSAIVRVWHSSLKLFALLAGLVKDDDTNEDLKDIWKEKIQNLSQGLANLLSQVSQVSDESNQPLCATNELLARQIRSVPVELLGDTTNLYALIHSQSRNIQQTAFDILHRQIPKAQGDLSIKVALDKSVARLPDELVSLMIQTPDNEILEDISPEHLMPVSLFSYLGAWLLTFDHFRNASDKVKHDYASQVNEYKLHVSLLDFIAKILGHAHGKPLDASKFDPTFYSFGIEQNTERDVQWLLIHLYYLCLSRLPSLAKSWWIDCRSRQVRAQVEPWTEKHFSSLVITDTLGNVADWAKSQDSTADDALVVKTNERTREVIASKDIDDQVLRIAVRLPANYPFGKVLVEGINRVAVDERKWKNWLINTQGVITFSDNSIADGLIAFRRNLSGQLKGQSECAICYSMVSEDKQLPKKKCRTCKNLFHGSCLFKWFKSSNSSTCPLCRTAFNYA